MRYHNITTCDMKNGSGLRVVLWVAGCEHHCEGCHNPQTWDPEDGLKYDHSVTDEIMNELQNSYISGLTLSGGDPLHPKNIDEVTKLCETVSVFANDKNIWLYTGYSWEDIKDLPIMKYLAVVVDGKFDKTKASVNYPWAGSTNQRVIDVQKSLEQDDVVLWTS